jgi:hypothetical protein
MPRRSHDADPQPASKLHAREGTDGAPTPAQSSTKYDPDEDEMELEPESRAVPADCREYAVEQARYYDRDHRPTVHEELIVTARTFSSRVRCVVIYGKVPEVEAYFAARFLARRNGPAYVSLAHNENKYEDRGLRVVASFI